MDEHVDVRSERSNEKHHNRLENPWWNPPRYDHDQFSEFMFGGRHRRNQNKEQEHIPFQNHNQNQTYIDYEQLMVSIDSLVESARNLKPLFQRFFPFLGKLWDKK